MMGQAWGRAEPALHTMILENIYEESFWQEMRGKWLEAIGVCQTNVFNLRPEANNMDTLCASKAEVGQSYTLPPLRQGKYIRPEFLPELDRLRDEILGLRPNLVLAAGAVASWALLRAPGIAGVRGYVMPSTLVPGVKVLPTNHPAFVFKNWSIRVVIISDLIKAWREASFPEIRRPERTLLINPSLAEVGEWFGRPAAAYAVDIETKSRSITRIGFARSASDGMVIPFYSSERGGNYWPSHAIEMAVWDLVEVALASPTPKIFQNGLYDMQYLLRFGLRLRTCLHDTMLFHHSLFPELRKSLGFLGSVYTNEAPWKLLRKDESGKREE